MATSHDHKTHGQNTKDHGGGDTAQAPNIAESAAQQMKEAASYVGQKAEDATAAVGSRIRGLGTTLRKHTPKAGMIGQTSAAVAGSLEGGGRYLEKRGLSGIGKDVTTFIQRNPIPAVLMGCGLGFMLARIRR